MSQGIYFLADERKRAVRSQAQKMESAVRLRPRLSKKGPDCVIPAEAGIQNVLFFMDSCLRRNDNSRNFSHFLDTLSERKSPEGD